MENSLRTRYPSAKHILDADNPLRLQPPHDLIKPYLGWKLLEVEHHSGCILLGQPSTATDGSTPTDPERIILGGGAALEWLHHHARNRLK